MNTSSSSGTAWPFEPLRPLSYGAIIADPPWAYEMRSANGYAKSPEAHYATMTEAKIAALPVGHLAGRDCLLFLWSTWPHLPVAMRIMAAWGFTYRTGGSWTKLTRSGKRAFGTGYIFRSATEPFLIGTIGEPAYRSKSIRNLIESERREHSRKPPEARAMIETLLPDVFACELFARETWPGHQVWGNEAGKFGLSAPLRQAQDTEPVSESLGGRAIGSAVSVAPVQVLPGDPVVYPEGLDSQFSLLRKEFVAERSQRLPIDLDAADLRRDRQGPDRLDDTRPIGRGSGLDEGKHEQDDGGLAHGRKSSGPGR